MTARERSLLLRYERAAATVERMQAALEARASEAMQWKAEAQRHRSAESILRAELHRRETQRPREATAKDATLDTVHLFRPF